MIILTMTFEFSAFIHKFESSRIAYFSPRLIFHEKMELISTLVLSAGVVQGILLIAVFLKNKSNNYSNILFTCFIGIVTMQVIFKLSNLYINPCYYGPVFNIFYFLPYLYGPLTYLYIKKSIDENSRFRFSETAHLLPFAVSVMIVLTTGYGIIDIFSFIDVNIYNITDSFVQLIVLSIYITACKKLFRNSRAKRSLPTEFDALMKWYNTFTNIVLALGVVFIIVLTLMYYRVELYNIKFGDLNFIFLLHPALIFWISYSALAAPELFRSSNHIIGGTATVQSYVKYQNNLIPEAELARILEKLNKFMTEKRAFLDPDLSLESLSELVNIPRHVISQAINVKLKMNFNDYVNLQRIENAKSELINPKKQHFTIAAIAFESGFNSISTFNETFKKHTSMTPSQFKKQSKSTIQ